MPPWRHQLPVYSPISAAGLLRAAANDADDGAAVVERLRSQFGARDVILTDSGTSALTLAIAAASPTGGAVALPGWGCPDLLTAAQQAGRRVLLYDLDPATLGPDLDSVRAAARAGAAVVVVAHFFGWPVDIAAVRRVVEPIGTAVVEDAAQSARGRLRDRPLGALADWSVLSFGRGKGLNAGGGGAMLCRAGAPPLPPLGQSLPATPAERVGFVARMAAMWLLGRPSLYALPASLPGLRLGEMRYHPPRPVAAIPRTSLAMLPDVLDAAPQHAMERRTTALRVRDALRNDPGVAVPEVPPDAEPGWLRVPALSTSPPSERERRHGVVRPYPRTLDAVPEGASALPAFACAGPGARQLAAELRTYPTHPRVTEADLEAFSAHRTARKGVRSGAASP